MSHHHVSSKDLTDDLIDRVKELQVLHECVIKRTGLPKDRTNVVPFYSLYPVEDDTYDWWDVFIPEKVLSGVFHYKEIFSMSDYPETFRVLTLNLRNRLTVPECTHVSEKSFFNYYYVAVDRLINTKCRVFLITEEVFTQQDIAVLAKYCQCDVCKLSSYSLAKLFACRECSGCLKEIKGEIRGCNSLIRKTREHINSVYTATPIL